MTNDPKSREVRLGLVMYGGVSLAIYINGVAHEMFRAVRGRGAYRLIKRLTDSDVVVDVMSGASAGGINGIFLAYALCNEVEFGRSARLWREHGDIDRLLRRTDAPPEEYRSLLDSEGYYHSRLKAAFSDMAGEETAIAKNVAIAEDPSPIKEIDLLVTGTDFGGRIYDMVDDRGSVVQIKDHRTVFWLKHRSGRKEPFHPKEPLEDRPSGAAAAGDKESKEDPAATHEALAKLARITSCFPAAFAPVTVSGKGDGADARLRRWAGLKDSNDHVFIDGGVLDNKPFTGTLDAIYHRTADRPVTRHLFFVEPDPERFEDAGSPTPPNLVRTAVDSLTRLPAYESIADDLRSLSAHNDQVMRFMMLAQESAAAGTPPVSSSGQVYRRARLIGLADSVFAEIFQTSLGESPRDRKERRHLVGMRDWFKENILDKPVAGDVLLDTLDVQFRMRRLFHLTYDCEVELLKFPALVATINNQIQTLEIVRSAMQAAVAGVASNHDEDPKTIWGKVRVAVSRVLAVVPPDYAHPDPKRVALAQEERRELKNRIDDEMKRLAAPPSTVAAPSSSPPEFLEKSDAFEDALFKQVGGKLEASYRSFAARDQALYPLEVVSGIREKDVIHTVRVSPLDAKEGLCAGVNQKVTGINLGHFAAFFKRSWRSNDILWGRLDAACELIDTLLDVDRFLKLQADGKLFTPSAEELGDYLPFLTAEKRADVAARLSRMTDPAAIRAGLPAVKALVIEAAHLEILSEGLRDVIEDAAKDQMQWNEFKGGPPKGVAMEVDPGSMRFKAGVHFLDPAVIAVSAAEIANKAVNDLVHNRRPTGLADLFKDRYRVGEETLNDIPRVVLLDVLSRALLVLRNCLLVVLGPRADNLRGSLVYKALLDWPLRILVALAAGLRRAPAVRGAFIVGSLLYTVLAVVVLFKTVPQIEDLKKVPVWGASLFVGLPVLLLAASAFLADVRNQDRLSTHLFRLLVLVLKIGTVVTVVGVLVAFVLTSRGDLCEKVMTLFSLKAACESPWLLKATTVGKVLVLVGLLFTGGLGRALEWLRQRVPERLRLDDWRRKRG